MSDDGSANTNDVNSNLDDQNVTTGPLPFGRENEENMGADLPPMQERAEKEGSGLPAVPEVEVKGEEMPKEPEGLQYDLPAREDVKQFEEVMSGGDKMPVGGDQPVAPMKPKGNKMKMVVGALVLLFVVAGGALGLGLSGWLSDTNLAKLDIRQRAASTGTGTTPVPPAAGVNNCPGSCVWGGCPSGQKQAYISSCGDARTCCITDTAAATPNPKVCNGGAKECNQQYKVYAVCLPDGTGWQFTQEQCGTTSTPGTVTPVPTGLKICSPGTTSCKADNTGVRTCNADGTAWVVTATCNALQVCQVSTTAGARCVAKIGDPESCTTGQVRCKPGVNNVVQTCNLAGWFDTKTCSSPAVCVANSTTKTAECVVGTAVPTVKAGDQCVPGTVLCTTIASTNDSYQRCDTDGMWEKTASGQVQKVLCSGSTNVSWCSAGKCGQSSVPTYYNCGTGLFCSFSTVPEGSNKCVSAGQLTNCCPQGQVLNSDKTKCVADIKCQSTNYGSCPQTGQTCEAAVSLSGSVTYSCVDAKYAAGGCLSDTTTNTCTGGKAVTSPCSYGGKKGMCVKTGKTVSQPPSFGYDCKCDTAERPAVSTTTTTSGTFDRPAGSLSTAPGSCNAWCTTWNCPSGDTNGDGQCTFGDSGASYTSQSGAGCGNPPSGCGQVDYYKAVNTGSWTKADWDGNFCGVGFIGFSSCAGTGGGGATATVTGTQGGVCSNVVIQTKGADGTWANTSVSDIASKVKVGDTVRFVVAGANGTFNKARFRVNDGTWLETSNLVTTDNKRVYYLDYEIKSAGQHKVEGQVYGI